MAYMRMGLVILLAAATAGLPGCPPATPPKQAATPLTTRVQRSSWGGPAGPGIILTTPHYRLYTTTRSHALQTYLPGFMEAAYAHYLDLTGLSERPVQQAMEIYMPASRREWDAMTVAVLGEGTPARRLEAGGYCYKGKCFLWQVGGTGTFSVAAHEGLHQFLYHRLRDGLPMWLEEGLCVLTEGHQFDGNAVRFLPEHNPARFNSLRSAILREGWIPLRDLLVMDSTDAVSGGTQRAVGYYGQLWALALMLREKPAYRAGLSHLMADAAAGKLHEALGLPRKALDAIQRHSRAYNQAVGERVFRHYFSGDLDAFEREYLAYAKALTGIE